jgi:hypothetical protein
MKAVAAQNTRVKDPVYHVVLSWPSGEAPSDDRAFACGSHALASVGMIGHQYVFAIHRDTAHVHMHIAVNRVDPATGRAVYPDRDFFKLDRAMRELELRFGWRHDRGPYAVFERNGALVIDWSSQAPDTKGHRPTPAADMERHADQESFFSYVRGEPRTAVSEALKDVQLAWPALHALLAGYGLALREKGQGFAIYEMHTGSVTPIKASDMHEALSKPRLVKRLGPFEHVQSGFIVQQHYDKFRAPVRDAAQRDQRRQERADARRDLRHRYEAFLAQQVPQRADPALARARFIALTAAARRRRTQARTAGISAAERKALYSIIAFETVRERERLRAQLRVERDALRTHNAQLRPSYREWVERQAAGGDAAAISQLRGWAYAAKRNQGAGGEAPELFNGFRHRLPADPVARVLAEGVDFKVRRDGSVRHRLGALDDGFIDQGSWIEMQGAVAHRGAALAALLLATRKFGTDFEVVGAAPFTDLVQGLRATCPNDSDLLSEWLSFAAEKMSSKPPAPAPTFKPSRA